MDAAHPQQGTGYKIISREAPWAGNGGFIIRHKEGYYPATPVDQLFDIRKEITDILTDYFGFIIEANHLASKSHVAHLVHTDEDVAVLRALDRANDENVAEFNTLYLAGGALLLASSISVYFAWRRRDAARPARSADAAGRSDGRDDGHE